MTLWKSEVCAQLGLSSKEYGRIVNLARFYKQKRRLAVPSCSPAQVGEWQPVVGRGRRAPCYGFFSGIAMLLPTPAGKYVRRVRACRWHAVQLRERSLSRASRAAHTMGH